MEKEKANEWKFGKEISATIELGNSTGFKAKIEMQKSMESKEGEIGAKATISCDHFEYIGRFSEYFQLLFDKFKETVEKMKKEIESL